jgi:adenosine deaminase
MMNESYKLDESRIRETWFDEIPKIELHVHLEGAIPYDALWELIQKYGGESTVPSHEALRSRFQYRDFPHFIETWVWKNQFLREYEDFTFIAEAVARDLTGQNVLYAEITFAPSDFTHPSYQLETQRLAEAIRGGLSKVPEIEVALIADLVRDRGLDNAAKNLAEVSEVRNLGIIGITIGGSEQNYPPEPFANIYERARQLSFHTSAHAGEAAGPESIWGAIKTLEVDRIGHGTRAIEDEHLVDYIAEHRIPIEIYLISNVKTRVFESIERHPVRHYFERGIPISINTDDPMMFGNSLPTEYYVLENNLGFSRKEIQTTILQAIEASWLPEDKKQELLKAFRDDPK